MVPPNPRRTCSHCGEYVGDTLHTCKPAEGTADHDAAAQAKAAVLARPLDYADADAYADGILSYTVWSDLPRQQNLARAYLERCEALLALGRKYDEEDQRVDKEMKALEATLQQAINNGQKFDTARQEAEAREKALREALIDVRDRLSYDEGDIIKDIIRKALESKP